MRYSGCCLVVSRAENSLIRHASGWLQMNKGLTVAIIAVLLSGLCGCGSSPEAQINKVLDKRKQGLEQKDIKLYMSTVSPDYKDGIETYDSIKRRTAGFFSAFDNIELTIEDRSIYLDGNKARVVEKYVLTFGLPSGKKTGKAEQLLTLRKEKDGWKIIKGLGKQ